MMEATSTPVFLIVDDEPDTCWALQQILRKLGICEIALNARDALSRAAQHAFSLVLLDAKLPDVDGLELALQFRAADPGVPILLVSGYFGRDDADVQEACSAGLVQAFVGKPFLHEDILRAVRLYLRPTVDPGLEMAKDSCGMGRRLHRAGAMVDL